MQRLILLLIMGSLTTACATGPRQNDNLNSVLWMQTAAEYRGNSLTIYHSATDQLHPAFKQNNITAALEQAEMFNCHVAKPCSALAKKELTPAVVLDIDETVLDNSIYQARLVRDNGSWNAATWDQWIKDRDAGAIPGAVNFIKAAKKQGLAIVYITNRRCNKREGDTDTCPQKLDTIENMRALGFPDLENKDLMLLQNEKKQWDQPEKKKRRTYVSKKYRIAMLIGDDLGDLAPNVKKISIQKRFDKVDEYSFLYGKHWFQLSNPTYGSWMTPFKGKNKYDFLRVEAGQ